MVFCTKYRYRVLTGQVAIRTREVIRETCAANYINYYRLKRGSN
ncbi:transposase [Candidatus Lariskella endosymbiont of Hedychridium roseum]